MESKFNRFLIISLIFSLLSTLFCLSTVMAADIKSANDKITQKVLVINMDPVLESRNNIKLHQLGSWWNAPKVLSEQYISDFKESTNGFVNYEIADWIDLDEFPRSTNGFQYDDQSYLNTYDAALKETGGSYWSSDKWHKADGFDFDYNYYIDKYNIIQRIQKGEIDEVWIFTGPCTGVGAYESQMVGKDAYWCNSPGIQLDDCRPFVIYAFNYERDVGCMLEDAGHRMESIMSHVFGRWDYKTPLADMNKWERFTLYDKVSHGNAACGNVHFAPNSDSDYDWGNKKKVMTSYVDWLKYPNLTGQKVSTNCSAWGNGDMRQHHKWWFSCIPKTEGVDENGYYNNWWKYFIFPTESPVSSIVSTTSNNYLATKFVVGQTSYAVYQGGSTTAAVHNMDASPCIVDGRVLVPVRYLADSLGVQTKWDEATKEITVTNGDKNVVLTVNSNIMNVNGISQQMEVSPVVREGRTYMPARYVAEALGGKVDWNQNTQSINVTYPAP